jgi:hypothetical protein
VYNERFSVSSPFSLKTTDKGGMGQQYSQRMSTLVGLYI